MDIKIKNYQSFFADQVKELIEGQEKINHSSMRQLFRTDDLALGYVVKVQPEIGAVIIKFPKRQAPRLKLQRSIVAIRKNAFAELGERPTEWDCDWKTFCTNSSYKSAASDITPLHFVASGEDGYDFVACTGLNPILYDLFYRATQQGRSLPVIVYTPFPPVDYYLNMINYMEMNPTDDNLFLDQKIDYEEWQPEELAFDENRPDGIAAAISKTLEGENICIVQGPPGTGKSYTIATIVASYLAAGKTVCVTTMANKGLVELIKQKPLEPYIEKGVVFKTHLSVDEATQIKGVHDAGNDLEIAKGQLLCATNYVLSGAYNPIRISEKGIPSYDLLVIEEASQAFLTTIAAFTSLGKKCLIVGDPMQLPPIANTDNPMYNSWNVATQLYGLTTFALGTSIKSYRIVTTFRLTSKSAALTGVFYGNSFTSVKKEYIDFSNCNTSLFPNDGGVLFYQTNDARNGLYSDAADRMIRTVISELEKNYPKTSLAIITPFRASVTELQKRFATSDHELDITIETIDRIQGMTVDYVILYLPSRNPAFALEDKHFNVGTSRSLSTTLIISDLSLDELKNFHSASATVLKFIDHSDKINGQGEIIQALDRGTASNEKVQDNIVSSTDKDDVFRLDPPKIGLKVIDKIDPSTFEKRPKGINPRKKNYYIIDTNVFVDCPDILSKIDAKYEVILSAKVADELDKMKIKLEGQKKLNAEKALKLLNLTGNNRLKYEFADLSLLPPDFDKKSPDNMILSIALKYNKEDNPIILTSDNGLQLKARILKVSTLSLKQFLKK